MSARARGLPAGMDAPQKLHCRLLRAPHIIRLLPCVTTAHTKHMTKQHGVQTPTTRSLWVSGKTVAANGCPSFSRVLVEAGAGGVIAMCPPRTQLLPSHHPHADSSSPSGPKSLLASHYRTMQPVPCMSLIQEITKGSAFLPPKKEPR